MSKSTNGTTDAAFQLKGSLFTLTVLHLFTVDLNAITNQLAQLIKQTPKFFQHMPIVLDLQKLSHSITHTELTDLENCLRKHNLIPIGIRGGNTQQQEVALNIGLAILPNTKTELPETHSSPSPQKIIPKTDQPPARLITQPVRSGQQIYAKNADLIVVAPVSPGAELLADGNIHVYGALRGRALAGVNGNQSARIFCQNLEAELIAIAGHYWVSEDLQNNPIKQHAHIYLENEKLHISTL